MGAGARRHEENVAPRATFLDTPAVMTLVTSRRTRASGVELHWVEAGKGPPLVLLHGLADSHRTWGRALRALARERRVIALDLPGHGLSGRPDAPYDLGWNARVVGQWCDYLGLETFDLAGHSYGGGVAQFLLLSHAHRVRRLALIAPGGLGRAVHPALRLMALPIGSRVVQPLMRLGTDLGTRIVGGRSFGESERRWLAAANGSPGSARAFVRTTRGVIGLSGQVVHFLDHAHRIGALPPMRLFWGDRDPVVPAEHGLEATRYLEGVRLVSFPGVGHFPHLTDPDRFVVELLAFLEDPTARPARLVADPRGAVFAQSGAVGGLRARWRGNRRG